MNETAKEEIAAALIEFRQKVEKIAGQPLINSQIDFHIKPQFFTFKNGDSETVEIKPADVHTGHWFTSAFNPMRGSVFFFDDEIKRGLHLKWAEQFEKQYDERVEKILAKGSD